MRNMVVSSLLLECVHARYDLASAKLDDEMHDRHVLDVVRGERAVVGQLMTRKDEALLLKREPLSLQELRLEIQNRVARLDMECHVVSPQSLHHDSHLDIFNGRFVVDFSSLLCVYVLRALMVKLVC